MSFSFQHQPMQIFVNIPGIRKTINLRVNNTETIDIVKSKIQAKERIGHERNRLWISKKCLKEDRTLFDYNVKEKSTLVFAENLLGGDQIKIKISTLTGKKIDLQTPSFATVQCAKEKLQEIEGIPPDQQRFVYSGQELENDHLLAFYNISNASVIHLVLRLRGGGRLFTVKYFKTLVIDLDMDLSVRRIKERIEELEGYPPALQQLTLDGRVLDDDFIIDESRNELSLEIVAPPPNENSSCLVS